MTARNPRTEAPDRAATSSTVFDPPSNKLKTPW